jgi:hypothetical protein
MNALQNMIPLNPARGAHVLFPRNRDFLCLLNVCVRRDRVYRLDEQISSRVGSSMLSGGGGWWWCGYRTNICPAKTTTLVDIEACASNACR